MKQLVVLSLCASLVSIGWDVMHGDLIAAAVSSVAYLALGAAILGYIKATERTV